MSRITYIILLAAFAARCYCDYCPNGSKWSSQYCTAIFGAGYLIAEIDEYPDNDATVLLESLHNNRDDLIEYAKNLCYGPNSPFSAFTFINRANTSITLCDMSNPDARVVPNEGNWVAYFQSCL